MINIMQAELAWHLLWQVLPALYCLEFGWTKQNAISMSLLHYLPQCRIFIIAIVWQMFFFDIGGDFFYCRCIICSVTVIVVWLNNLCTKSLIKQHVCAIYGFVYYSFYLHFLWMVMQWNINLTPLLKIAQKLSHCDYCILTKMISNLFQKTVLEVAVTELCTLWSREFQKLIQKSHFWNKLVCTGGPLEKTLRCGPKAWP